MIYNPTSATTTGFVKTDQTIPQTIINGTPIFDQGMRSKGGAVFGTDGVTTTIGNVTSGSATQVDGTEGVDSQYFANGGVYQIKVWAYKVDGENIVYSATPYTINFTDNNDLSWFHLDWNWGAVAGASGYKINYVTQWNSTLDVYFTFTTNSFTDGDPTIPLPPYTTPIVTPGSPHDFIYGTGLHVVNNATIDGGLDVAHTLTTKNFVASDPVSFGTTNQKAQVTIEGKNKFAGLYVKGTDNAILVENQDGSSALQFVIGGSIVGAMNTYADSSIEFYRLSSASIWFDSDGSISIPKNFNADGDFEATDATKGVILKSPNGTRYRITVSNAGVLTTTAV